MKTKPKAAKAKALRPRKAAARTALARKRAAGKKTSPRKASRSTRTTPTAADTRPWDAQVIGVVETYAQRGVIKGLDTNRKSDGLLLFRIRWHRDRTFVMEADKAKKQVAIAEVLPKVPPHSPMDKDYRHFVGSFQDGSRPRHRSFDPKKVALSAENLRGRMGLKMAVKDEDFAYAAQKLLTAVHETYMCFVAMGPYDDYRVSELGADPDWGK